MAKGHQAFRVRTGLNYPGRTGERRAEAGEVVTELPSASVPWLLAQGHIEPAEDGDDRGGEG